MKISRLVSGVLIGILASAPLLPAIAQPASPPVVRPEGKRNKLNLTEAQREQMRQIRDWTRSQIDQVLTADQKQQLQAAREQNKQQLQQGQRPGKGQGQGRQKLNTLNLTDAQKERIRAIRQEARQRQEALLTPEQRQQAESQRQEWQRRRQEQQQLRQQNPNNPNPNNPNPPAAL